MSHRIVKLLYKGHAWIGLVSGVLLSIITASGSVAVFKPEIDRLANPSLLTADPSGERRPWDELLAVVRAAYPGAEVLHVSLPRADTEPCGVLLKRGNGGFLQVTVDPYNGRILGSRNPQGTLADSVRQFHVRLLMGFWGRVFVGAFGLVLLASTVTGLWIYAPMNKRSWVPRIRRDRGSRVLLADLHKVVGVAALLFNLVFAVSGAVLGLENLKIYWKPGDDPAAAEGGEPDAAPFPRAGLIESGLRRAAQRFPGMEPSQVAIDRGGRFRVYVEHPLRHLIRQFASHVTFDAQTGAVVEVYDATEAGFWLRTYYAMEPLHFGRFGGLPVQILYALMGLVAGFLSVSGYAIYAIRMRGRGRSASAGARPAEALPHAASGLRLP